MTFLKRTAAVAACALIAAPAFAGGMSEPMVEAEPMMPVEVIEEASGSSGGIVVPLLLLAVIAAVASSSSGGDVTPD